MPPTPPATTRTACLSSKASAWSAARSPTRRPLPPEHLSTALTDSGPARMSSIKAPRVARRQAPARAPFPPGAPPPPPARRTGRDPPPPHPPPPQPDLPPRPQTRPAQLLPSQTPHRPDHPPSWSTDTTTGLPTRPYLNGIGP